VIGVGGLVDAERREADWRYVMERRRSPEEVEMSVEMTEGSRGMCSAAAIWKSRVDVDFESSGVKRNFEHRDARGSIILLSQIVREYYKGGFELTE
jgi:hypothetical protein